MAQSQESRSLQDEKQQQQQQQQPAFPAANNESTEALINISGHVQELPRNYSLWSAAAAGVTIGNVWPAFGGAILTSLFNGGPPGAVYEFITVSIFYFFVAASIAELSSAIPSAGGVYHWASVTPGPRAGRVVGFFAGYWNWLGWVFGAASMSFIFANTVVQMWALKHADFVPQAWHVFVSYIIITWIACLFVCFGNKFLPYVNQVGCFFIIGGFIITVVVVAVMPSTSSGSGYATNSFVWKEWSNELGYPDGFVFVAGMLNGAYAVGAVDAVSHISEEVPFPQRNIPWAILFQTIIGFVTGLCYLIAILYAISDYTALFDSTFPLAEIYRQATGSAAGAIGLLSLILFCVMCTMVGTYIDAGRTLWTLGRDMATPFPKHVGRINHRFDSPIIATLICGVLVTVLGCIYVGSTTAFNAFIGSFVLMSSSSYIAAILPNVLTGRSKNINYGPFNMKGWTGWIVNIIACAYMIVWFVIYCFPFVLPVNAKNMNYGSLLWGGLTVFIALWWFVGARRNGYVGPRTTGGLTRAELVLGGTAAAMATTSVMSANHHRSKEAGAGHVHVTDHYTDATSRTV